jgi:hypothetical protein
MHWKYAKEQHYKVKHPGTPLPEHMQISEQERKHVENLKKHV